MIDYGLSTEYCKEVNASQLKTALAEYGLLPVELQQSENCKLKSKNVRDYNEKSNILAAGHRNDDHSACRMRQKD